MSKLTLLPLVTRNDCGSLDILYFGECSEIDETNLRQKAEPLEDALSCHLARHPAGGSTYGSIEVDGQRRPLTWLYAEDIRSIEIKAGTRRSDAIWGYLNNLPGDWRIVLYWE